MWNEHYINSQDYCDCLIESLIKIVNIKNAKTLADLWESHMRCQHDLYLS